MIGLRAAACVALVVLAGCGGAGGRSGWTATDACAVLDKAVVAATLGSAVQSAELNAVQSDGGGSDLYSQCSYKLADRRLVVFGTGQSTSGLSDSEVAKHLRNQAKLLSDEPLQPVPGLGKAGLQVPSTGTIYTVLGDGAFASALISRFSLDGSNLPPEQVKADEIALLHKIGA